MWIAGEQRSKVTWKQEHLTFNSYGCSCTWTVLIAAFTLYNVCVFTKTKFHYPHTVNRFAVRTMFCIPFSQEDWSKCISLYSKVRLCDLCWTTATTNNKFNFPRFTSVYCFNLSLGDSTEQVKWDHKQETTNLSPWWVNILFYFSSDEIMWVYNTGSDWIPVGDWFFLFKSWTSNYVFEVRCFSKLQKLHNFKQLLFEVSQADPFSSLLILQTN